MSEILKQYEINDYSKNENYFLKLNDSQIDLLDFLYENELVDFDFKNLSKEEFIEIKKKENN